MDPLFWPWRMFRPRAQSWRPVGSSVESGRPATGSTPQRAIFGGGGLMMARLTGIRLRTREETGTWDALDLQMDGGANPIIVTKCDRRSTPRLPGPSVPIVPHRDGTLFSDGSGYASGSLMVQTRAAADFRATRLSIRLLGGRPLIGGEMFSIDHPTALSRMYKIARVESAEPVANGVDYVVTFRPPLRESVVAGVGLEMELPRCVMKLTDPDGMDYERELNRFGDVSVGFTEDLTQVAGL